MLAHQRRSCTGTGSVLRYDANTGAFVAQLVAPGDGGLGSPKGLAVRQGDVFVASLSTDEVLRFDAGNGQFIDDFVPVGGGGLRLPTYLQFAGFLTPVMPGALDYSFSVVYTDPDVNEVVDAQTIDDNDILVEGPNGYSEFATRTGLNVNSVVTTQYTIAAPVNTLVGWDDSDNGAYTISVVGDEVFDFNGNAVPAGPIGQFVVNLDNSPPLAQLSAQDVLLPGSGFRIDRL